VLALAVPLLWAAFRGGGYDIVPRQELALVVWWAIAIAAAVGFLPRARPARGVLVPLAGLGLLLVLTTVSLHWTASQESTVAELARVALYAGVLVLILGLVDRRTWMSVAAAITAVAVIVALAGTLSRLAPGLANHAVERVLHTTRLSYPLNYWNAVGAWSAIAAAMALLWSAHAQRLWVRALALACVPGCALTVYLAYSRASILDLVLGLLLALAFGRHRWTTLAHAAVAAATTGLVVLVVRGEPAIANARGSAGAWTVVLALAAAAAVCAACVWLTWRASADSRWRLSPSAARAALGAAAAAVAVTLVVLVATGVTGRAWAQFEKPAALTAQSDPSARLASLNSLRYRLWQASVNAWEKHPFEGIGPGTYDLWWNQHATSPLTVRDAHSLYLENLAELGVGGLVAVLLFAGGLLVAAIRARPSASEPQEIGAYAALCTGAVIFFLHAGIDWLWESTAVGLLGVACAATAAAGRSVPLTRAPALKWRVPVVLAALVLCLVELPGLVGTLRERDATQALAAGDKTRALRLTNDAVNAEPWAASALALRGEVLQQAGRTAAARADFRRAVKAEPTNWRNWFLLARLEAAAGRSTAAVSALTEARRLDPRGALFQ
jgi:O-antigen ligase